MPWLPNLERGNPRWKIDFLKWLADGDHEYRVFNRMADVLQRFIIPLLEDPEKAASVAKALPDVLRHCDKIDFNEPVSAEAYSILHFLDRYHRFQIIFKSIIQSGKWPRLDRRCVCVDIGAGPAPALFAMADMVRLISEFSVDSGCRELHKKYLVLDYVEQSVGFRNWLHHFTEHANVQYPGIVWGVPYHHGTFVDFNQMEFNQPNFEMDYDDAYPEGRRIRIKDIKYRFNMIIASNFFTSNDSVVKYEEKLKKSAIYTKNNGVIVFAGASSSGDKYKDVYNKIDDILTNQNYSGGRYVGSCERLSLSGSHQSYSWSDRFGERLKSILQEVLAQFRAHDVLKEIEPKILNKLEKTVSKEYNHATQWELHVYNRQSKLKWQNFVSQNKSI